MLNEFVSTFSSRCCEQCRVLSHINSNYELCTLFFFFRNLSPLNRMTMSIADIFEEYVESWLKYIIKLTLL